MAAPCATRGQRYRLLMTVFSSMASTLADMPRSTFGQCMQWVTKMDDPVRSGAWIADVASFQSTDAVAVSNTVDMEESIEPDGRGNLDDDTDAIHEQQAAADVHAVAATNSTDLEDCIEPDNIGRAVAGQNVSVVNGPIPLPTAAMASTSAANTFTVVAQVHVSADDNEGDSAGEPETDGPPSDVPVPFRLPTPVRHKGRPARVKQRTFRKKAIPFVALSSREKDEMRVCWFVDQAVMVKAVRGGGKIQSSDLQVQNFTRSLEYCEIDDIKQYFTNSAWKQIEQLKSCTGNTCAACSATVPVSHTAKRRKQTIKWVECGHCLLWFHLVRAGVKSVPRKWFCADCRA